MKITKRIGQGGEDASPVLLRVNFEFKRVSSDWFEACGARKLDFAKLRAKSAAGRPPSFLHMSKFIK